MVVVSVVALALGSAACKQDPRFLPAGEFSGSTSLDQRLHLSLQGDDVKVNGEEAEWDGRGRIKLTEVEGEPVLSCETRAKGEELVCEVPRPAGAGGGVETVELMRE